MTRFSQNDFPSLLFRLRLWLGRLQSQVGFQILRQDLAHIELQSDRISNQIEDGRILIWLLDELDCGSIDVRKLSQSPF